jgi:large subunit ribosomal protein L17
VWVADPNVPDSKKDNPFFDLPDAGDIEFNRYGEVRKAPRLVQHIMTEVAPKFSDRDGGYTRIVRTGRHRLGDGTDLVILQLVGEEDGPELSGDFSGRRTKANRRAAFAAKLRKGAAAGDAAVASEAADEEATTATAVAEPEVDDSAAEEQAAAPEATDEPQPDSDEQSEEKKD